MCDAGGMGVNLGWKPPPQSAATHQPDFLYSHALQVLPDHQRGAAAFAGGADDLFGAFVAYITCGKNARDAGFQQQGIALFKAGWPFFRVQQRMAGDDKPPFVQQNAAVCQEPAVGHQADLDEHAGQFVLADLAGLAIANGETENFQPFGNCFSRAGERAPDVGEPIRLICGKERLASVKASAALPV